MFDIASWQVNIGPSKHSFPHKVVLNLIDFEDVLVYYDTKCVTNH